MERPKYPEKKLSGGCTLKADIAKGEGEGGEEKLKLASQAVMISSTEVTLCFLHS